MTPYARIPKRVEKILATHRRDFLKSAGLLVVSFATGASADAQSSAAAQAAGPYPELDFRQLDSWSVIHENNTATFYVGKTDCGQGTGTSFRQLMSDELDIAYDQTTCIMGSTDNTVDQGGSGGSTAIERDSWPMRRAAAEARRVLLEMGAARLGTPVDQLAVNNAVITVKGDPSKRATYGELIGGKKFNVKLTGANINAVTGVAKVKPVQELRATGQSPARYDIPAKVDGSLKWAVDVKLPGMVHARNVKPPFVGAKLTGGLHQGGEQGHLCGRGVRARRTGHPRRPAAQDHLGKTRNRALSRVRESVPVHAHRDCHLVLQTDRGGEPRIGICRRGKNRRGGIRSAVPGTCGDRRRPCHGGSVERSDDDLYERHEVLWHA